MYIYMYIHKHMGTQKLQSLLWAVWTYCVHILYGVTGSILYHHQNRVDHSRPYTLPSSHFFRMCFSFNMLSYRSLLTSVVKWSVQPVLVAVQGRLHFVGLALYLHVGFFYYILQVFWTYLDIPCWWRCRADCTLPASMRLCAIPAFSCVTHGNESRMCWSHTCE